MDVYQILMQDHRTVEQLFIDIEQTDDREVERREQLFGKLRVALEDHTVVEENLFYPEIDKYPAIKELIAEAFDEHAEFEQTLQQISELPTDKADWLEMIKRLEEVVQEHVRKEEDKMFSAARKELDESRAEELGRQILEMKQEKSPDRALASTRTMMKALVYQVPGNKQLEERPVPQIEAPSDAVVKVVKTTICGTDLHILKGDVPSCSPGRILGHEGVGVVEKTGAGVTTFHEGDRVLISCISACGKCTYCRRGMYSHCTTGGWILGNRIDGTQAEYVRIPHADTSLYPIPPGVDEEALVMLSDILPTGFECGVLNGKVEPGSDVAIVGAGPIGLAALLTAQFYSPAAIIMIDLDDNRLDVAKSFGATAIINATDGAAADTVMNLTGGRGVDTAIEAVGVPATFVLCENIVAPGGTIANVGVHGVKADLHLERLWSQNITITTRLVDTVTTPMLLRTVQAGKIEPKRLITHHFKLAHILDAYDTFGEAARTHALKVIIEP
jgi:alcohol dehydrogenase